MDKKIILGLAILILTSGLAYGTYSLLGVNDNHNSTTNNITAQNNATITVNNTTTDKKVNSTSSKKSTNKKSNNKYWCDQCQEYHPSPVQTYHRYGNCPICGKWVDTQTTSHTHDGSPGYKEEPQTDTLYE